MESMYQQWPGMTLEKNYENSLISLCVHVLRYLNAVPSEEYNHEYKQAEEQLNACMSDINKADAACRGFTVTISDDVMNRGTKRKVEDVSDEDDDSHSTVVNEDEKEKETALEAPPRAKRITC
jgi:hypothetical protein